MKIVALSDTHMGHSAITDIPSGDMIIHAGDLTSVGKKWEVKDFLDWFDSLNFKYKIFIAGNHDFLFEQDPIVARKIIPNGVIYLQDESVLVEGIKFYGSPYTLEFGNWAFMKKPGKEMYTCCSKIPTDTDVIITHGPPFGILDQCIRGKNLGSIELTNRINQCNPLAHVFGHIHEGHGRFTNEKGTQFINASILNDKYLHVNDPVQFVVEARSFINS